MKWHFPSLLARYPVAGLLLVALLLSGAVAYLASFRITPGKLEVVKTEMNEPGVSHVVQYNDFDHDRFSERIDLWNGNDPPMHHLVVSSFSGGAMDQLNFHEPVKPTWLLFADYTGEGYDEIFTFTQKGDSLFLYVHDLQNSRKMQERVLLLTAPEDRSREWRWDIDVHPVGLLDTNRDGRRELIFTVKAALSLKPRAIFAYEIHSRSIIRRFDTAAQLHPPVLFDLNGDGGQEIVFSSLASGNIDFPADYRDDRCWLFVLNSDFQPLFAPMPFSEFPANLLAAPVRVGNKGLIFLYLHYYGKKKEPNYYCLVDAEGNIQYKVDDPGETRFYKPPLADRTVNPPVIYGLHNSRTLVTLNEALAIVRRAKAPHGDLVPTWLIDLDNDGRQEVVALSASTLAVFDKELNHIAGYQISGFEYVYFSETGKFNPVQICVNSPEKIYHLKLLPGEFYPFLPRNFLILSAVMFMLLFGLYILKYNLDIRRQLFQYAINGSPYGLAVLDGSGNLRLWNSRFLALAHLREIPRAGNSYRQVFRDLPVIVEAVGECLKSRQGQEKKMAPGPANVDELLEIRVAPAQQTAWRIPCFLVEIRQPLDSRHSQKLLGWSRSIRKITHQIRAPLHGIMLNIFNIETRLSQRQAGNAEILKDLGMIQEELERVNRITRSFLKYTDLETPQLRAVDIPALVDNAWKERARMLDDHLKIHFETEHNLPAARADARQIEMVVQILLDNAVEALNGNGEIRIEVQLAQELNKDLDKRIYVTVSDNGPGMDEATMSRIFEQFYTTKPDGVGIGLMYARKIIEDHGGEITVESRPGRGTEFCFTLPVYQEDN